VFRAGLGVGPDARRIIVRRSGDEARTEDLDEASQRVLLGLELGSLWINRPIGIDARLAGAGRTFRSGTK
jgi:hypothetical protein